MRQTFAKLIQHRGRKQEAALLLEKGIFPSSSASRIPSRAKFNLVAQT